MSRISVAIEVEAAKLIRRHETYARQIAEENERRVRRTMVPPSPLLVRRPLYWTYANGFDPYRTRARADSIGHAVRRSIVNRSYTPKNPASYEVPKPDGTTREVAVFQVADNAISRMIFESVLDKNRPLLSARSYAYRSDLTVHDAVRYICSSWSRHDRLFIAEYDFSRFFDKISHDYVWNVIEDEHILMTDVERMVIHAFLDAPKPVVTGYTQRGGPSRETGVPQGTSISLLLANIAASPLDRALEQLGVGFVRYADDTLIWSSDYGQLCKAVDQLHLISHDIGAELNPEKSEGIRLLVRPDVKTEFRSTTAVDYVGHSLSLDSISMRGSTLQRIRQHLNQLLYFNLLAEPLAGTQDPARLGKVDRDYVTFIWQARRYLYGDVSENQIRRYQAKGTPPRRFKGLMSFYPLVDDSGALVALDRWLATQTWLVMKRRADLLQQQGLATPDPHGVSRDELVEYRRQSQTTGGTLDLRLPSFVRIGSVLRRAASRYGPNRIGRGGQKYGY